MGVLRFPFSRTPSHGSSGEAARFVSSTTVLRVGLPLLVVSAMLHWLLSSSIYPIYLKGYDADIDSSEKKECMGTSSIAMLITLIVFVLASMAPIIVARRKMLGNMPLYGNSSAVISAACHKAADLDVILRSSDPGFSGVGMELEVLKWGVLKWGVLQRRDTQSNFPQIGHLGFGAERDVVGGPEKGELYM